MAGSIPGITVLILAMFWPGPGSSTMMYNELVVLGDSLSDQGNVYTITGALIPPPEYTDGSNVGRFTNGLNYIDYLAPSLGLTVAPSVLGGSNYAYGGARTDSHPLAGFGALSLLGQRDAISPVWAAWMQIRMRCTSSGRVPTTFATFSLPCWRIPASIQSPLYWIR